MTSSRPIRSLFSRLAEILKFGLLPLLASIYPIFFHYANNLGKMGILPFLQLGNLFMVFILAGIASYVLFLLIDRGQAAIASLSALILLLFFNFYGLVYTWLRGLDIIQVEHYTFLAFFIVLGMYGAWVFGKLLAARFQNIAWNACVAVLGILLVFNLTKIIPYELKSTQNRDRPLATTPVATNSNSNGAYPDIYYIIFDEYAGFEAMRDYWRYSGIDVFTDFLHSKGFFIAENSHGDAPSTLPEMASRLNYEVVTSPPGNKQAFYDAIRDNRVMEYLKQRGYSTVVFNGLYYAWLTQQTITADFTFVPQETHSGGFLNTEFEALVLKNTMALPFMYSSSQDDPVAARNRSMLFYTLSQLPKLTEIHSPKFVYIHLMLPHFPFLFDANGEPVDPQHYADWDYYLGNYIYATKIAQKMVTTLLNMSDPARPPVIILQSDHGARNGPDGYTNYLKNYPESYPTLILNAFYLPGCNTAGLTQDLKPINTFPIVFNCYFNTNIPLK